MLILLTSMAFKPCGISEGEVKSVDGNKTARGTGKRKPGYSDIL